MFDSKKYGIVFTWLILVLFISSCGKPGLTGKTGQVVSLNAEIVEDGDDLEIIWTFLDQPDASMLNTGDFSYSENRFSITFIPDAVGEYAVNVKVIHYGDELSSQTFTLVVDEGAAASISDIEHEDEKEEWYEDEHDRQWFEEETAIDTTPPVPEISEVSPAVEEAVIPSEPEKKIVEKKIKPAPRPPQPRPVKSKPSPGSTIPYDAGRFTIQVLSKKQLVEAEAVAAALIKDGFDAYIQKAYFKETDEVWFRVRVGSYNSREEAKKVAISISKTRNITTWVDFVRLEE